MQPRIFKRCNSVIANHKPSSVSTSSPPPSLQPSPSSSLRKPAARKGRKGHLYKTDEPPLPPTPEEQVRIIKRRMQKAERDERMDITMALTPPKTYMGGFTRPRDLRASNWFPGGPYLQRGKSYESPPESAYEPHTFFILESRYRVRHGVGRVDAKDHVVGVCRAVDFVKLVKKYNSPRCPTISLQSMDNACWPWLPKSGKVLRPTRWWGPDENLEDIMKEIYEDENYKIQDMAYVNEAVEETVDEEEAAKNGGSRNKKKSAQTSKPNSQGIGADDHSHPIEAETPSHSSNQSLPKASGSTLLTASSAPVETPRRSEPPHMVGALKPSANYTKSSCLLDPESIRSQYLPRLASEPFWLPLIACTFSTRPLSLSVSRLSKALPRGLPFYASMTNDDRKCLFSYSHRMTCLRLGRVHHLVMETVRRLTGHKGGFVGIRFDPSEKGRGIGGDGLADPIKPDKRIVKVLVGNWYGRAQNQYELYKEEAEPWGGKDAIDVTFMNEWGRRLDAEGNEVPLSEQETSAEEVDQTAEEDGADETDEADEVDPDEQSDNLNEEELLRQPHLPRVGRKLKLKPELRGDDKTASLIRRKLARLGAQGHRSVIGL